eukprot:scaffold37067_cov104-Phaeocystis_antarctica.AAC.1
MTHHEKEYLFSDLLRLSKCQRLQELLLALKTRFARPSPQPLRKGHRVGLCGRSISREKLRLQNEGRIHGPGDAGGAQPDRYTRVNGPQKRSELSVKNSARTSRPVLNVACCCDSRAPLLADISCSPACRSATSCALRRDKRCAGPSGRLAGAFRARGTPERRFDADDFRRPRHGVANWCRR